MLRPHERLVGTHYAFHVNNAKHCSLQPSDDGHEPHVGGQAQNPQRQLRPKRTPNAVNGGALLAVLVVRIPTSANMLNTCTALSNRVGLRSTTSSQPMVYAPMHALISGKSLYFQKSAGALLNPFPASRLYIGVIIGACS